jgi:hypothetical protein
VKGELWSATALVCRRHETCKSHRSEANLNREGDAIMLLESKGQIMTLKKHCPKNCPGILVRCQHSPIPVPDIIVSHWKEMSGR